MPFTAATIEYDFIKRPAWVPARFTAAPGGSLRFLSIKAIDGTPIEAALWQPEPTPAAETTLIVAVHGSGANFTRNPTDLIGNGVSARGAAVLAINTRQHDDNVNTENFFDIRKDLEAAIFTARALGYRKLVLQGHSLGNIQVQYYAATHWDADIRGVILLGMFANLPWKTRHLLVQDEDSFDALTDASMTALREHALTSALPVKMGSYQGNKVPVSGQHFLTYRWDRTSVADGTFWIRRIPRPILMIRDEADAVIQPFEPSMLLSAARAEGSLVESISYQLLPNPKPPSLEGHAFADTGPELVDTIISWLTALGL